MTTGIPALPPLAGGRVPLLGHAWAFLRDPLAFLASLPDHGGVVTLKLGPKTVYAVCSPALVAELLVQKSHASIVGGRLWEVMADLLGDGPATSNGATHRRQRRIMRPAFAAAQIPGYSAIMQEEIEALVSAWRPGQVVDINRELSDLAVRTTARSLLQGDTITRQATEVTDALNTLFRGMYRHLILPFGLLKPLLAGRRFTRSLATLHRVVDDAIAERRTTDAEHHDLLTELMSATDEAGAPLSHRVIHDIVVAILTAGAETVSSGMCSTLHLLARHPDVTDRVHRELGALGGHSACPAGSPALPLTTAVINESLRVAPPAWIFTRRATDCIDLGGYRIPRGADIFYSIYALHHDPRSFPQPHDFDPDRWLDDRADAVPRNAMIPFGVGNRRCPGDNFAMAQMTLTLTAILSRWQLVPVHRNNAGIRLGMTLRPKQLRLRVDPA